MKVYFKSDVRFLEELAAGVMKAGKEGLCSLEALADEEEEEAPEFEDGL